MLRPHSYQPPDDGLPPQDVRIINLKAEPWPDGGRRVRISLEVTPFLERPDLEILIRDSGGEEVSNINIVESIDAKMTFTMHIRSPEVNGLYTLSAILAYPELGKIDEKSITFEASEPQE